MGIGLAPVLLHLPRERIEMCLHVAGRTGVGVLSPDAADTVLTLVDREGVDARLLQLVRGVQSSWPGAENGDSGRPLRSPRERGQRSNHRVILRSELIRACPRLHSSVYVRYAVGQHHAYSDRLLPEFAAAVRYGASMRDAEIIGFVLSEIAKLQE